MSFESHSVARSSESESERHELERAERARLLDGVRAARAEYIQRDAELERAMKVFFASNPGGNCTEAIKPQKEAYIAAKKALIEALIAYASWTSTERVQPGNYDVTAYYKKLDGRSRTHEGKIVLWEEVTLDQLERKAVETVAGIGMHNLGIASDEAGMSEAEFAIRREGERDSLDQAIRFFNGQGSLLHYPDKIRQNLNG